MIKVIITILFFAANLFAQSQLFDKSYYYTAEFFTGDQVFQLDDGGYLLSAHNVKTKTDNLMWIKIFRLDKYGNILWTIQHDSYYDKTRTIPYLQPLALFDDESFLVWRSDTSNSVLHKLTKYSREGNFLWETSFEANNSQEIAFAVQVLTSGNVVCAAADDAEVVIRMLGPRGNKIWEKIFRSKRIGFINTCMIKDYDDDSFLYSRSFELHKVDHDGNIIWSIFERSAPLFYTILGTNIYYIAGEKISVADEEGNILRYRDFDIRFDWIDKYDNEHVLVTASNKNYIINKQLEIIDSVDFGKYIKRSIKLGENKFALLGERKIDFNNSALRFALTDKNFTHNILDLLNLSNMIYRIYENNFYAFDSVKIKWIANVDKINIYDSFNGGKNWNLIEHGINADLESYQYYFPAEETDEFLIKIEDYYNPNNFDIIDTLKSVSIYQNFDRIEINEQQMWFDNRGGASNDPRLNGSGLFWPKSSDPKPITFTEGFYFGGKVNGEIRVNGSSYRKGLVPGSLLESGLPDDPLKKDYKIYRYRKDWHSLPPGNQKNRLEFDYNNWPVQTGAPYLDFDKDGVYTPGFDQPGNRSDDFFYFVANSADSAASKFTHGSPPTAIEVQVSTWGYDREDELQNVVFKKIKVTNKENVPITDTYFTYKVDDDLGDASDDYVGCDTTYNMGYTYNGDQDDQGFFNDKPPAVGRMFIQGPVVESSHDDSAFVNSEWIKGHKNLPVTSFMNIINAGNMYTDPWQGVYDGTLQFYNIMEGNFINGYPKIDPHTGDTVKITVTGDPVEGTGWYQGVGWPGGPPPGNQRYYMSTGPFTIEPGESKELIIAVIIALGNNNIDSITELRKTADKVIDFYFTENYSVKDDEIIPIPFELKQNYPNPFNPTTTIEYTIPEVGGENLHPQQSVKLIVYDILGREVATLVNEQQKMGRYKVVFNASKLSSGVYLYRITSGDYSEVKKMILLR
ncbi:MAG: T9SS type A sorting domain-containing protein [Melioribacteraceae bacterium]|nr:T9SS type A sorting domain-containing protein [Melioribacteraceae bacterium]